MHNVGLVNCLSCEEVSMPGEERLLHENAALVALLNTVDNKTGRHLDIPSRRRLNTRVA